MSDFNTLIDFISNFSKATGIGKSSDKNDSELWNGVNDTIHNVASFNSNSLRHRVKDLIAQYPILFSDNLTNKSLMLCTRAFEHEYVNMLALLINNDSIASKNMNSTDFLSQFHNNIFRNNTDLEINMGSKGVSESYTVKNFEEGNIELLKPILNETISLNDKTRNRYVKKIITEAYNQNNKKVEDEVNNRIKEQERKIDQNPTLSNSEKKNQKNNIDKGTIRSQVEKEMGIFGSTVSTTGKDSGITTIDIKKTNDLVPTMVSVDITFPVGGTAINKKIMFGVKCVAHIIRSEDIEYYLPNAVSKSSNWAKLIRWTTGELKFFKDLVFSVDEIKKDAIKSRDKNSFWWRKLKTLADMSKSNSFFKRALNGNKDIKRFIPITTMIISKQNVDNIKNNTGIDILSNPNFANKILKNFFLMTFAIVDESIETLYLFNEQTKDFDSYSFNSLSRETKQNNIDIKDVYKIFK